MSKHHDGGLRLPDLSIAEMAEQTGVSAVTLRAWEQRHGFPAPERLAGGHRRYTPEDVTLVHRVLAERAAGSTLGGAIARARQDERRTGGSFFAEIHHGPSRIESQVVSKRTMIALSHAIEDESSARAERALLVGVFQEQRFFAAGRGRWRDLASGAQRAVVFSDFSTTRTPADGPAEVPMIASDALEQEWAVVVLAPRSSVLLLGRELPGERRRRDLARRFELVWSAAPAAVWAALETAVRLARRTAPSIALDLRADLNEFPYPLGPDPAFVTALTNRMVGYLDR